MAGLTLLCLLLPLVAAPAAQNVLSEGVSFSGLTLAVTSAQGDDVPRMLEQVMSNMSDISQYCAFRAMEPEEAASALRQGEVTAILELPENFVQGILNGENPDVTLIVPGDRPLDALLTLWVGQSASDMLASFQNGIYAVLALYRDNPAQSVTYDDVMTGINLRYINWTMNRQDMFRTREISAVEQLPVGLHYGLSLLSYLLLSLSPLFMVVYQKDWLSAQRRFRAVGRGEAGGFFSALTGCAVILFPMILIPEMVLVKGGLLLALGVAAMTAVFCAAFGSLCCLVTTDTGACGALSFSCSLIFLAVSGGIVPPVMLPASVRNLTEFSPVTWMRNGAVMPAGEYGVDADGMVPLMTGSAVLILLSWLLYRRRCRRLEGML